MVSKLFFFFTALQLHVLKLSFISLAIYEYIFFSTLRMHVNLKNSWKNILL